MTWNSDMSAAPREQELDELVALLNDGERKGPAVCSKAAAAIQALREQVRTERIKAWNEAIDAASMCCVDWTGKNIVQCLKKEPHP